PLVRQDGAGYHDGKTTQAGKDLQGGLLEGQLAEEGKAQADIALRKGIQLVSPRLLLLKGNDLAETLHGIDRKGGKLARRFPRQRSQAIHSLAQEEGAQARGEQEGQQRERDPGTGRGENHQ